MAACPVCRERKRGVMVARLVRIRHDHVALTRGILPHDIPSARQAASDDAAAAPDGKREGKPEGKPEAKPEGRPDAKAPRPRHAARHPRTSRPAPPHHPSPPIPS